MSFAFTNWFPTLFLGTWKADTINGTDRADIIVSFGKNDTINAGGGNDIVLSGAGNDVISAGNGNDIVEAGSGDDVIDGGLGSDTILGGAGFDIAVYSGSVSDYSITLPGRWLPIATVEDGKGGTDLLTSVEALYFKADDYTLYLDGRNNAVLARDDAFSVDENAALTFATSKLTANDKDFDGDKISVTGVSATSELGATVTLSNGKVSYDQGNLFDHLGAGETAVDTFTYTVKDGRGGTDTATVSVTINGVNDAPEITSAAAASVEENSDATVLTVAANDVDGDEITYSILGGADASLFAIDAKTGELKFAAAPDFETPADQGGDNVYEVTVGASDGKGGEATQDVTVSVTDLDETPASAPRINEIHYDNDGADTGEFVEIRVAHDTDVSGMSVELYNGSNGATYGSTALSGLTMTSDGDFDYYVWDFAGIQNGSPDGLALSNNGSVIEFLSYEGTLTATNGTAAGQKSIDIGVEETASSPAGQSLQRTGDAPTDWIGPEDATKGAANEGGGTDPGEPTELLISEVQGTGTASQHEGDYVLLSAVVTYTLENGFYLQEEATDSDGNALTSEGIFVFTGGAPSVAVGDVVKAAGTVDEFFGLTEITDLVSLDVVSSGNDLPDYSDVTLPLATSEALEQFEGMRISLTSGTGEALTVTENFSLDRYGEIAVSAGNKYQPTQVLDPTTDADAIASLTEANLLNRLVIDDGVSAQNPTEYKYIPASVGDNGNGYLDSGDTFSAEGPTLRLGAEIDAPVKGVLSYGFDAYRMYVDGQLSIDESTNSGAREDSPADVGGTLKVSSFNLLNFFTTLNDGSGAGSGPENLEPRGATTQADLERQLDKIVASMLEIDADVFGLQELENNGFTSASAINTLVNALNDKLGAEVYAFVDPTGGSADGFIGTDAITTGVIYKQTSVTVVGSDFLEFDSTWDGQQLHRPAIAVAFEEISSGERFTVAVNHLKSKGDSGLTDVNDANYDQGDGQSFWNAARAEAAEQLAAWLATDPTGSGDSDALIIGDLNSYAQEDPVDVLRDAGFIDLIDQFIGQENAYSYVFDGQRGALDQGLSTASLLAQITGVTEWHINSDEPGLLSYSSEFKDPDFYSPDVFATSDHDPLIIGIDLGNPAVA